MPDRNRGSVLRGAANQFAQCDDRATYALLDAAAELDERLLAILGVLEDVSSSLGHGSPLGDALARERDDRPVLVTLEETEGGLGQQERSRRISAVRDLAAGLDYRHTEGSAADWEEGTIAKKGIADLTLAVRHLAALAEDRR